MVDNRDSVLSKFYKNTTTLKPLKEIVFRNICCRNSCIFKLQEKHFKKWDIIIIGEITETHDVIIKLYIQLYIFSQPGIAASSVASVRTSVRSSGPPSSKPLRISLASTPSIKRKVPRGPIGVQLWYQTIDQQTNYKL